MGKEGIRARWGWGRVDGKEESNEGLGGGRER